MEVQMRYIARLLTSTFESQIPAIDVRRQVFEEYNDLVERTAATTVWTHPGTNTFFRNARGRLVFVSPFRNVEYWARAQQSGLDDYETLRPAPASQPEQAESA
jgi:4-hydroxyacetophenone monooxygenase